MTQMKKGEIGYILGYTPVKIMSDPNAKHMVDFIYLRDSYNVRMGYTTGNAMKNYHKGDSGQAKMICLNPQDPKYAITDEEMAFAATF